MSGTPIRTFSNQKLEPFIDKPSAKELPVALVASKTYRAGERLKETATRGIYDIWDGTGNWQLLCSYPCVTDASGNITKTTTSGQSFGNEHGSTDKYSVAYYSGVFDTKDLPGINTAALTGAPAGGRLLSGVITDGLLYLP